MKRLLAVLFGLVVALLLSELVVRIGGLAPEVAVIERGRFRLSDNPRLGYEPVPNLAYDGEGLGFYDYRERSNRLGFRDDDHALEKPSGTYRIAVLGDSVAAGLRIERRQDTFPEILERRLRAAGHPVEVLSFAVSGYNTQQEVEMLVEKGLQFDPDLVLVAYCLNDEERMDGGILETLLEEEREAGMTSARHAHEWLLPSALYRFVRFRVLRPEARAESGLETVVEDPLETSFARLRGLASRHGFEVLVTVFPRGRRLGHYRLSHHHDRVHELSRENGFHHLDLLPAFRRCRQAGWGTLTADSLHPNEAGHRCAGEATARHVARRLLGDSPGRRLSEADPASSARVHDLHIRKHEPVGKLWTSHNGLRKEVGPCRHSSS